jgi:transcriptional regulator with XRE-family HTH domain
MNLHEYGTLIREHRKKARLTQQQLASETGMSRITISLIETGNIPEIGARKLSRLCMRLGLALQIVPDQPPPLEDLLREADRQRAKDLELTSKILSGIRIKPGNPKASPEASPKTP